MVQREKPGFWLARFLDGNRVRMKAGQSGMRVVGYIGLVEPVVPEIRQSHSVRTNYGRHVAGVKDATG